MASNQRTRNLDKSTRGAMSGIEWALTELVPQPIQHDEFTIQQFIARSGMNRNSAATTLAKKEKSGDLASRIGCVDGKSVRIYRKA